MHELVKTVTLGGLLHDIGKALHRGTSDGRAHSISGCDLIRQYTDDSSILDCIRYHHHQELTGSGLSADNPAYIVYVADNISSGADRREIEGAETGGFSRKRPQESIYNLLNNSVARDCLKAMPIREVVNYPGQLENYDPAGDYNAIIAGLRNGLEGISFTHEYVNSVLELTEAYLSYVPASTYLKEVADISLFDHSKTTAALAACTALYLDGQNRQDYRTELYENYKRFYKEKAFCLFSCDVSGVQPFIYSISSKGALKGLRARSFYLELLLENLVDEILGECSLYRSNLLYSGGAHAYILLPNTVEAKTSAVTAVKNLNDGLLSYYGSRLFVACGLQECCANELMSRTEDPEAYSDVFRSVSAQISEQKLRRYDALQVRKLNESSTDKEGRECRICGTSAELQETPEGIQCKTCSAFADISRIIIKPNAVFSVSRDTKGDVSLPLFSFAGDLLYFQAHQVDEARAILQDDPGQIVRLYSKNIFRTGLTLATRLWMGDYAAVNEAGELKTFSELAENSKGIPRIGVLRADVDNMGSAFVRGFVRDNDSDSKYRYLTLSRTATLSRSLSVFFKYYLNNILANSQPGLVAGGGARNIVVVYSGGDDLFIVGAWNEVLAAAIDIRTAFKAYTGNTLTISAGMGIFESGYPIARMAAETEILENAAKNHVYSSGVKNSISLFGMELQDGIFKEMHTYDWDTFESQVLGEKYRLIDSLFSISSEYGNSFLYNIVDLLRQSQPGGLNIARLAYLLARREPHNKSPVELKQAYKKFAARVYEWSLDEEERRQLLTAIIIYTYNNRE